MYLPECKAICFLVFYQSNLRENYINEKLNEWTYIKCVVYDIKTAAIKTE